MKGRPGLSAAQKVDLWQRWKQGQLLSEIGRALDKHPGSIHGRVDSRAFSLRRVSFSARRGYRSEVRPRFLGVNAESTPPCVGGATSRCMKE